LRTLAGLVLLGRKVRLEYVLLPARVIVRRLAGGDDGLGDEDVAD